MTSQPSGCPSDPAHRPTVARLTGFKRRGRTFDRSQLLCFQWIYERTGARRALFRLRTLVEARSAPGARSLGQLGQQRSRASAARRALDDGVGAPGRRGVAARRGSPRRRRRCAIAGGAAGLHVAQVVADVDAVAAARRRAAAPPRAAAPGCGLACGVVSPQTSAAARSARPSAATSGAAKRVALLVTMPQAMPRAASACEQPAPCRRRPGSRASCAPRSCARNSSRSASKSGVAGRHAEARRRPCRARPSRPSAAALVGQRRAGRARSRMLVAARRRGRARCRSACRRGRTGRRAARVEHGRSCRLAARDQVVDAGVAGQPVAPRQRVVFHAARRPPGRAPASRHQPASSLGRMNFAYSCVPLRQQLAARTRRRRSRTANALGLRLIVEKNTQPPGLTSAAAGRARPTPGPGTCSSISMQVTTSKLPGLLGGERLDRDLAVLDAGVAGFERVQLRDLERLGREVDAEHVGAAPRHRVGQDAAAAADVERRACPRAARGRRSSRAAAD